MIPYPAPRRRSVPHFSASRTHYTLFYDQFMVKRKKVIHFLVFCPAQISGLPALFLWWMTSGRRCAACAQTLEADLLCNRKRQTACKSGTQSHGPALPEDAGRRAAELRRLQGRTLMKVCPLCAEYAPADAQFCK